MTPTLNNQQHLMVIQINAALDAAFSACMAARDLCYAGKFEDAREFIALAGSRVREADNRIINGTTKKEQ